MENVTRPEYDDLTREQLIERLSLAEDLCRLYGWSPANAKTPREKATYMIWSRWYELAGIEAQDARNYPHLSDAAIAELAAERDAIRERTLAATR